MLTGGTSAFPSWGLWLAAAIAATSITVIALLVFAFSHRVRRSSIARVLVGLLVLTSATTWIGYRIESNQRWAARSLVLEAADAFDETDWTEEGLLRVSTMATEGCAQDNGAFAERQLLMLESGIAFTDMTQAGYASALEQLDSAIERLEALGFSTERRAVENPSGILAMTWMTRGDATIRIQTSGSRLRILGASNECNSALLLSRIDNQNDFVNVVEYSIESVCSAAVIELHDRCLQPK